MSRFDLPLPQRERRVTLHVARRCADKAMLDRAAASLHLYFAYRSKRIAASVSPASKEVFLAGLAMGRRDFAGVLVDDRGEIVEDGQRPQLLREFRQLEASAGGLTD